MQARPYPSCLPKSDDAEQRTWGRQKNLDPPSNPRVGTRPPAPNEKAGLFEVDEDYFGNRADSKGRAPGAGTARGIDEKVAEALQAVGVGPEDTRGKPRERKNLAAVRVTRKLQRDAVLFGDGQAVRDVRKQNAGPVGVKIGIGKRRPKTFGIGRIVIRDAHHLQAV